MDEDRKTNRSPRAPRPNQKLLTISQATIETGIPGTSIHDLLKRGLLRRVRFGDGKRRIWLRRDEIEALIEQSTENLTN